MLQLHTTTLAAVHCHRTRHVHVGICMSKVLHIKHDMRQCTMLINMIVGASPPEFDAGVIGAALLAGNVPGQLSPLLEHAPGAAWPAPHPLCPLHQLHTCTHIHTLTRGCTACSKYFSCTSFVCTKMQGCWELRTYM